MVLDYVQVYETLLTLCFIQMTRELACAVRTLVQLSIR